jgi:imidazolonepropionase-like amidohydrolase
MLDSMKKHISTTRLPSEWLEINNKVGTVEPGKYADLILLDANL